MRYGILMLVCCLGLILGTAPGTQAAATDTTTVTIAGLVAGSVWGGGILYDGIFEATGGIEDEGTAEGSMSFLPAGSDPVWTMTLTSSKGTLTLKIVHWGDEWKVTRGTRAYGGASGGGIYEVGLDPSSYATIWMLTGTVVTKGKGKKQK